MSDSLYSHAVEKLAEMRSSPNAPCKICESPAHPFDLVDFNKSCQPGQYIFGLQGVPVMYRMCSECQFIFTDFGDGFTGEQWQTYVYDRDYIRVDPDYVHQRPLHNAREIASLLTGRRKTLVGLDYGGGNGKTAALLRENGWTFDCYDPFGTTDMSPERIGHYNFCSAIEVFEHATDPVGCLGTMLQMMTPGKVMILIGTSSHDNHVSDESRLSWWYAAPRNGHISLYSRKSLRLLGERFGLSYICGRGGATHVMARGVSESETRALLLRGKLLRRFRSTLKLWPASLA